MMHQHGSFATMHKSYGNTNLMQEMIAYFSAKISYLKKNGLKDIIIDPGLGFSKSLADNYHLLKHLSLLEILEAPILVGLSRKSMIQKVLKTNANDSLNGSTVLHTLALQNGANILRVHDVKEANEAIQLYNFYSQNR
jgi:dihydropteroate synthase